MTARVVVAKQQSRACAFGAKALLDFRNDFIPLQFPEVGVRPRMATNRMARRRDLLEYLRVPKGMFAGGEKLRLRAMLRQGGKDGTGIFGPRTTVKREHHLFQQQEVVHLVPLKAKSRAAGGINLHRAGDAERVWLVPWACAGRRPTTHIKSTPAIDAPVCMTSSLKYPQPTGRMRLLGTCRKDDQWMMK